jgi:CRP-like cAMP-binding protein
MALEDDVRNLACNATFAGFETEALRLLAFSAETRILRAGDVLFRRGDAADSGFVVLSGSIALTAKDDGSAAERIVSPQTLIGDIALMTETQRAVTAIARETSSVLKISRVLFHRVLKEFPRSAELLRSRMEKNLQGFVGELMRSPNLKS